MHRRTHDNDDARVHSNVTVPPLFIGLGPSMDYVDALGETEVAMAAAQSALCAAKTALNLATSEADHWRSRARVRRWSDVIAAFLFARYERWCDERSLESSLRCSTPRALCAATAGNDGAALDDA